MSTLATRVVGYLRGLEVTQGARAGQPFEVLRWQSKFLRGALAPGVAESSLSLGRGNGKSTLIAAVGCAALEGPLAQPAAEVLIVASSHAQGQIVFRHCLRFLGEKLSDRSRWRVSDTVNTSRLVHRPTGTMLEVKGSDPRRLHGAAASLIIADEMAQWPAPRMDQMLSVLRTTAGKIPGARFMAIGTRPDSETHPFAVLLRDADFSQTHAMRPGDPLFQRRTWKRANPSLDHMPDLAAAIRREAKAAKRDPALLAQFSALRLNAGVPDTVQDLVLSAGLWESIEGDARLDGPCWWGIDLGGTSSQSAVAAYWPQTGALQVLAAFPSVPSLEERGRSDGVSGLYRQCWRRGELLTLGSRAVPVDKLLGHALDRFGRPAGIASDRWREGELRDALDKARIPRARLELRGMGFRDMGEDLRAFRRAAAEGRLVPAKSLLMRASMAEARTVNDPAGNAKLRKQGRRRRAKDDAVCAAVLAVGIASRHPTPRRRRLRSTVV